MIKVIINADTATSKYRTGDIGEVDGYVFDPKHDNMWAIVILEKDGTFQKVPLSWIQKINKLC